MRFGWILAVLVAGLVAFWLGELYTEILTTLP